MVQFTSELEALQRDKSLVFEPKKIGGMMIKNRLVRSATYEAMAKDGAVTDHLVKLYGTLAEGGVGLIITGAAYVQQSGKLTPISLGIGIDSDSLIPGLQRITETVHKYGDGCKVAVQLIHAGRQASLESTLAPSAVFEPVLKKMPREMTLEEVKETIEAFAEGARRAKKAGFDAVQLHAAHGYLLSSFLSPYTNRRTDEYGGNTENRIKIVEDIFNRTVDKVGTNFPILIKMNADDFLKGGIDLNESTTLAERFSKAGFAAIEISGSMTETLTRSEEELGWRPNRPPYARLNIRSKDEEAYFLPYAREIKKVIDAPLILVGGIRSLDVVETILAEGSADFASLCRPLIRQPDLPNRWLEGIGGLTADCISCNGCLGSLRTGGIRCIPEEKTEQKSAGRET